jgi:hypothetical protein
VHEAYLRLGGGVAEEHTVAGHHPTARNSSRIPCEHAFPR